jgi:three-Cys-motif partner protein
VGSWAVDEKHEYLRRYVDATRATRRKFLEPGSHGPPGGAAYVDLFAGPGRVRVRERGELADGSPMLALGWTDAPFSKVVLCEKDPESIAALRHRTAAFGDRVHIEEGDCNERIESLVAALPRRGLVLAVIDPFAIAQLRFSTIQRLARCPRVDFIINLPTSDIERNLKLNYAAPDNDVLARALGDTVWRERILRPRDAHLAGSILAEQLARLGYTGAENQSIPIKNAQNRELYRLVFASKKPLGDRLWRDIVRHGASGQRALKLDG